MSIFDHSEGTRPLLVCIPHDGREMADGMGERMTETGRGNVDADWHIQRLYEFSADLGASVIAARYSRYVVDLNRAPDNAALYENTVNTGIVPTQAFDGRALYQPGREPTAQETAARIERYWQPYHQRITATLDDLTERFGGAVLFDAHSINPVVPRLFEGSLPDFNFGTVSGASAAPELEAQVYNVLENANGYSAVLNGRFKGGYTTRHYGEPARNRHALQLELSQTTYMNVAPPFDFLPDQAEQVTVVLRAALGAACDWACKSYPGS